jgi:hypothetical protein
LGHHHPRHSGIVIRARSIPLYFVLACLTIAAGLASRRYPAVLPEWIARYAGDTLWAALVFWLLALMWRRAGTMHLAGGAITIAFAVEVSQLYRATWIDAIRETGFGSLVFGSGFLWSDLVCYSIGVGGAAAADAILAARATR